jgi:predicted NUDIX family phosphoesterase
VHPYRQGLLREISEEVILDTAYRETCLGFINDDATPVGQVHLGIVHIFELEAPKVARREADLIESGFAPIAQLRAEKEGFETWSQFVLDELVVRMMNR